MFVRYAAASIHIFSCAAAKGWELFYLVASAMPPSKDYVGLVSEYVHTVSHNDSEEPSVRAMAQRTWNSLKRSAKAGPRKTVNCDVNRLVNDLYAWLYVVLFRL